MFVCLFSWHVTMFVYTLSLAQFLLERSCAANLTIYYANFLKLLIINNIMIIIFIIIVLIIILTRTIVTWYIWFFCYYYMYSVQFSTLELRLCLKMENSIICSFSFTWLTHFIPIHVPVLPKFTLCIIVSLDPIRS